MKKILLIIVLLSSILSATASPFEYSEAKNGFKYVRHKHNESSYQHAHCSALGGIEEYELPDKTRVDCLTDKYAIEYDFANKIYEMAGQIAWYSLQTGLKGKGVIILDKKHEKQQMVYVERAKKIGDFFGFEVEYITDDILNIDKKGHCPYIDCKCNKTK